MTLLEKQYEAKLESIFGGRYFDRSGNPMSMIEWGEKLSDQDYVIIEQEYTEHHWVSTVWLGMNHRFDEGLPLIFETMVFMRLPEGGHDINPIMCERYSTESDAIAGHIEIVLKCAKSQSVELNEAVAIGGN